MTPPRRNRRPESRRVAGDEDLLSSAASHPSAGAAGADTAAPATSPNLAGADAPPAPVILEYTPLAETERWRVARFELLAAEMELPPPWEANMVLLHEAGRPHTRQWLIARKLFGIAPMLIPDGAAPEDFQAQSRETVGALLGLGLAELQAELNALRAIWRDHCKREGPEKQKTEIAKEPETARPAGELAFDDELLARHGFDDEMFQTMVFDPKADENKGKDMPRSAEKNRLERNWFASRVQQWEKMLSEPMSSATAREALMNELYLRRIATEQSMVATGSPRFRELSALKKTHEAALAAQLKDLAAMFPEMNLSGKVTFRNVLSDLNRCHREYYGRKDRRLMDGMFTAQEIEVLLRQSVQSPEAQYRFDINIAVVECMHNLYDPNFRSQFKPHVLKKLTQGFRAGVDAMRESLNEPLVDLERGVLPGEGDDYPDLLELNETETEIEPANA